MTQAQSFTKTSESVSAGHPDKVADQIADSIFDFLRTLKQDPQSAVEVACGANTILVFGEIDADIVGTSAFGDRRVETINKELSLAIRNIVRNTLETIGYPEEYYDPAIILDLVVQSTEINAAVEATTNKQASAGDQGIVTGYAIKETEMYHALHYWLAHKIVRELERRRVDGVIPWLYPDAKTQVTVEYAHTPQGVVPQAIDTILVSHCHHKDVPLEDVRSTLQQEIITIVKDVLLDNEQHLGDDTVKALIESLEHCRLLINPAGAWSLGGPLADSGLTGRKLVVDNYGSAAPIGGGAQSGKNANKVDRSGACYARHIAKSIVHNGLAQEALVEIGFAIGVPTATSWNLETFGTETIPVEEIRSIVEQHFDFSVESMIQLCNNTRSYAEVSAHGFYTSAHFPWEGTVELR